MSKYDKLFELRDLYFDDGEEGMLDKVKELNLTVPDFMKEPAEEETELFVCPDVENELPFVIEFNRDSLDKGMSVVSDAVLEYYKYSDFYDCCTEISVDDLVKIFLDMNDVKIVKYYSVGNTSVLNTRWLRSQL